MESEWIYIVEFKVDPPYPLGWIRLGQFRKQVNAVKFAEKCRMTSIRDKRRSSYRVVPVKLMDEE